MLNPDYSHIKNGDEGSHGISCLFRIFYGNPPDFVEEGEGGSLIIQRFNTLKE